MELINITDHEKIALSPSELVRVARNKEFYRNEFEDVEYWDANGRTCTRPFNSYPLSKIASRKLAKLVFNEGVSIAIEDNATDEFIQDILEKNRFSQVFGEELEGAYAVSGMAILPVFDAQTRSIKLTYHSADNFIPLGTSSSFVDEACIVTTMHEGDVTYTLLAFHEKHGEFGRVNPVSFRPEYGYKISYELYRSEVRGIVGKQVSLKSYGPTSGLSPVAVLLGRTEPLFSYVKLAGKNNKSYGSPLGLGVIDNSYQQLRNFNNTYDKYMDEIDTATRQLVASSHFFKADFDPNGNVRQVFRTGTRAWQKLAGEDPIIQDFSPEIRAEQYIQSLNYILELVAMDMSLSAGTFTFDGREVKTATQVISEDTDTYQTRADNVLIVSQALRDTVRNVLYLADYYGIFKSSFDMDVSVDFDDGIFTSKMDKLNYVVAGRGAGLLSVKTAMRKAYGWSEEEADEEYQRIQDESKNSITNNIATNTSIEEMFGAEEM